MPQIPNSFYHRSILILWLIEVNIGSLGQPIMAIHFGKKIYVLLAILIQVTLFLSCLVFN